MSSLKNELRRERMKKLYVEENFEIGMLAKSLGRMLTVSKAILTKKVEEAGIIITGSSMNISMFVKNTDAQVIVLGYPYEEKKHVLAIMKFFPGRVIVHDPEKEDAVEFIRRIFKS